VWLAAAVLVLASAALMVAWPRGWWMVGAVAVVLSQAVILFAWRDAWAGTLANVILLVAVAHGWLTEGPGSFRAKFDLDASAGLARPLDGRIVTEDDLAPLPDPVRRYLRVSGVVGQPRVANYQLRFTGRIRSGPDAAWMPFEAFQVSFADPPTRLFLMRARMYGAPVEAFHRYIEGHATMQVKLAGIVPITNANGPVMDLSETVTLFNDMCLLAPGTLLDPRVAWEAVDARTARARFTNGGQVIAATLLFDDEGRLVNFVSDDRSRASPDGKTFTRLRFSTPVSQYRQFGPVRLGGYGEARWHLPEGEFTYGEFHVQDVAYNVQR